MFLLWSLRICYLRNISTTAPSDVILSEMKAKRARSNRRESLSEDEDDSAVLDLFRKNFEQQFGAIAPNAKQKPSFARSNDKQHSASQSDDSGASDYEEFSGFDDDSVNAVEHDVRESPSSSDSEGPQVVKFVDNRASGLDVVSKREKKRFMVRFYLKNAPKCERICVSS
jgi:hypothetical protein